LRKKRKKPGKFTITLENMAFIQFLISEKVTEKAGICRNMPTLIPAYSGLFRIGLQKMFLRNHFGFEVILKHPAFFRFFRQL